jgi:hypothetical protein
MSFKSQDAVVHKTTGQKGTVESVTPFMVRPFKSLKTMPASESDWRLENLPPSPPPPKAPPFGVEQKKYGTFGARRKSRKSKRKTRRHRR